MTSRPQPRSPLNHPARRRARRPDLGRQPARRHETTAVTDRGYGNPRHRRPAEALLLVNELARAFSFIG